MADSSIDAMLDHAASESQQAVLASSTASDSQRLRRDSRTIGDIAAGSSVHGSGGSFIVAGHRPPASLVPVSGDPGPVDADFTAGGRPPRPPMGSFSGNTPHPHTSGGVRRDSRPRLLRSVGVQWRPQQETSFLLPSDSQRGHVSMSSAASTPTVGGSFDDDEDGYAVPRHAGYDDDDVQAEQYHEYRDDRDDGAGGDEYEGNLQPGVDRTSPYDGLPYAVSVDPTHDDGAIMMRPTMPTMGQRRVEPSLASAAGDTEALHQRRQLGGVTQLEGDALLLKTAGSFGGDSSQGGNTPMYQRGPPAHQRGPADDAAVEARHNAHHDDGDVDNDDDDEDGDLDEEGLDEEEPGVGPDGRTMTAPLSASEALALLQGDWQALGGVVPPSADNGASAGSTGYDPTSPTKPLSKMKKAVLLKQAQQAVVFAGQLQQAQMLLMQQQQVIAHLQSTGLRLQSESEGYRQDLATMSKRLDATRISGQVDRAAASQYQREMAKLQQQQSGGGGGQHSSVPSARDPISRSFSGRDLLQQQQSPRARSPLTEMTLRDVNRAMSPQEVIETFVTALQRSGTPPAPLHLDDDDDEHVGGSTAPVIPAVAPRAGDVGSHSAKPAHKHVPTNGPLMLPGIVRHPGTPGASANRGPAAAAGAYVTPSRLTHLSDDQATDSACGSPPGFAPLGADGATPSPSAVATPRVVTKKIVRSHAKAKTAALSADAHNTLWGGGYGKMQKSPAGSAGGVGDMDPLNASYSSTVTTGGAGVIADVLLRMNGRLREIETHERSREGEVQALKEENLRLRMGVGELAAKASHLEIQLQIQNRAATEFKRRLSSAPGGEMLMQAQMVMAERDVVLKKVGALFRKYAPGEVELAAPDSSSSGLVELSGLVERVLMRAAQMRQGAGASLGDACRDFVLRHFPQAATKQFDVDPDLPVLTMSDCLTAAVRALKAKRSELNTYAGKSAYDSVVERLKDASVNVLLKIDAFLAGRTDDAFEETTSSSFLLDETAAEVIGLSATMRHRKRVGRLNMKEDMFPVADHVLAARNADAVRELKEHLAGTDGAAGGDAMDEHRREAMTQTLIPRRAMAIQTADTTSYCPPGFMLKLRPSCSVFVQTAITTTGGGDASLAGIAARIVPDTRDVDVQAVPFVAPRLRDRKEMVTRDTQTRSTEDGMTSFRSAWPWRAQIARLLNSAADADRTHDVAVEWLRGCYAALRASAEGTEAGPPNPHSPNMGETGSVSPTAGGSGAEACLRLIKKQLDRLREVTSSPPIDGLRSRPAEVLRYALAAMLERGLQALDDAMERPLAAGLLEAATHTERGLVVHSDTVDVNELNHIVQRLMARIDVRLVKRDLAVLGSQRAINGYHQRIIEALVDNALARPSSSATGGARAAGLTAYSDDDLATMRRLSTFDSITPAQQRRLSELQILALTAVTHAHIASSSFTALAVAAGCQFVDEGTAQRVGMSHPPARMTPADAAKTLQLSLAAPSVAAAKIARLVVCRKLLPPAVFDDLGALINAPPPHAAASTMGDALGTTAAVDDTPEPTLRPLARRFIADIFSFSLEELIVASARVSENAANDISLLSHGGAHHQQEQGVSHQGATPRRKPIRKPRDPSVTTTISGVYTHGPTSLSSAWRAVTLQDRRGLIDLRMSWLAAMKPCDDVPFVRWVLLCGEVLRRLVRIGRLEDVAGYAPVDLGRARDTERWTNANAALERVRIALDAESRRFAQREYRAPAGTSPTRVARVDDPAGSPPPHTAAAQQQADAVDDGDESRFAAIVKRRRQQMLAAEAAAIANDAVAAASAAGPAGLRAGATMGGQSAAAVTAGTGAGGSAPSLSRTAPVGVIGELAWMHSRTPEPMRVTAIAKSSEPLAAATPPPGNASSATRGGKPILSPIVPPPPPPHRATPPPTTIAGPVVVRLGARGGVGAVGGPSNNRPPPRLPRMQSFFEDAIDAGNNSSAAGQQRQQKAGDGAGNDEIEARGKTMRVV
jgi:hypothetical protein